MKRLLLIIFILRALIGFSQDNSVIDAYDIIRWDCSIIFLPSETGANETYSLTPDKFKHKHIEDKRKWRIKYTKKKRFKSGDRVSILNGLNYLSKNICNETYLVDLNSLNKDNLYAKMRDNTYLNFTDEDKDNYNSQVEYEKETSDRLRITQHNMRYKKLEDCR